MNPEKLLIICYSFPPAPGIGGRRWAKFANYLHRSGLDIQVLSAQYNGSEKSEWQKDILALEKDNRLNYFNPNYPGILQSVPENWIQKFKYHFELRVLKKRVRGNFYDRSSLCKKSLLTSVEKFVKQGYINIIISVGPFYYSKYLLEIKKTHPQVKLFLDVRDPWTNNKTAFGYWNLTKKRFAIEKQAETEVANGYDKIFTVADEMGDYFIKEYGLNKHKVITIKNGFDTADFAHVKLKKSEKNRLLFTGNLYQKAEKSFLILVDQLKKLKSENSDFFKHYECHFYGEIHPSFATYFSPEINLFFHGRIPLNEVFIKISESVACLLFLTDDLNFSFSTKFYEYLSQKKPIIVFSLPGPTGIFIETQNLGKQANADNLIAILKEVESESFYQGELDIAEFDVKNLTNKLLIEIGFKD
ncbi:MAG: glycosyltransferase [bacterium]|nr:glycosyltransferase [bacterium]